VVTFAGGAFLGSGIASGFNMIQTLLPTGVAAGVGLVTAGIASAAWLIVGFVLGVGQQAMIPDPSQNPSAALAAAGVVGAIMAGMTAGIIGLGAIGAGVGAALTYPIFGGDDEKEEVEQPTQQEEVQPAPPPPAPEAPPAQPAPAQPPPAQPAPQPTEEGYQAY
jgi:hypothetical protein